MPEATTRPSRWKVFAPDTAGAIYGIIAAMAVIAGTASTSSHAKPLSLTVATLLVFWLAHVYAQALSHHLRGARRLEWSVVREAMSVALWLGVAELLAWGILYARRQRWSWVTALIAGAINALFGLLIVFL